MDKSKRNIVYEVSLEIEHKSTLSATATTASYSFIRGNLKNKSFMEKLLNNFSYSKNKNKRLIGYYIDNISNKFNISGKELYESALISKSYFYEIINGKKHPSRNVIIQISFGLGLNIDETNLLLKKAEYNELYLRNKRDMIIAYHLEDGSKLLDVNEELEKFQISILGTNS